MSIQQQSCVEELKQWREALECALSDDKPYIDRCKQAITSIDQAIAQAEKQTSVSEVEPVGYAGVRVWIGDQQVCRVLTQTEIQHAINPWRIVEMTARSCIAKLKEKNT